MRHVLMTFALLAVPASLHAQAPDDKDAPTPIKVIEIKRTDAVKFEKEIFPILKNKCITCHSGNVVESRFNMSTYEGIIKGGKRGTAVVPGKKESSLLYKLSGRMGKPAMPPKAVAGQATTPVTPEELALIGLWIDQGAKAPPPGSLIVAREVVLSLPPTGVQPVRAVAISPDKALVAASRGNQVHIYQTGKGDYERSLFDAALKVNDKAVQAAHVSLVEALAFSPDGKYLVSGSFREISIWDPKTGEQKQKITGFAHEVVSLAFSQDGKVLATGGGAPTEDGEVKFFEVGTWKQLGEIKAGHSDTVYGLCFSPNEVEITVQKSGDKKDVEKVKYGLMIATCSADKFIKVWEVPTGKFVKSFEGHTHHVLDIGWAADGKLLASAGADNTVKVWDFEKGEQARTINNAHSKQVTRLLFIGKKNEVLTCSGDAQVKIFNVANGGVLKTYAGASDFIYAVAASTDGALIAAGGQEGVVRLYNGTNGQLIRQLLPPDAQPKDEKKK